MRRLVGIFIWLITALSSGVIFVYLLTLTNSPNILVTLLAAGVPTLALLVFGGLAYLTVSTKGEFGR
ncbi:MAG: hypothetical protein KDE56_30670 [Anaerolineales bacterium]|nr:hypothetical protein [Anaerolineales bacterium]